MKTPATVAARILLAAATIAATLAIAEAPASAHTPHDDVSDVALSPAFATDHTVFAISDNRPLRSTDGGMHWTEMARGLTGQNLAAFATAPSDPKVVYLSTRTDGIHRSVDAGISWQATNSTPAMRVMSTLAVSPRASGTVLAAVGLFGGLFRTLDGGNSWTPVPGIGRVSSIVFVPGPAHRVVLGQATGVFVSDDDGTTFHRASGTNGVAITAIATGSAGASTTMFAGTKSGTFLTSSDAGSTWASVGSGVAVHEQIDSVVMSDRYSTDRTLWASTFDRGAYRSTDAGRTWIPALIGLTTDDQAHSFKLPEFQRLDLARDENGRQLIYLAGYDGLFRTSDGGAHWQPVETLTEYVTGLAVSPNYDVDRTVQVNTYVKGVYLSRDGGATFGASDHGLEHVLSEGNKALPVRRMHDVVFSPAYAQDHTIFTATWDAFVKSTDGGRTWDSITVSPPVNGDELRQFVIAVSPGFARDRTIYLGTRQGIVYESTGAGDEGTWRAIATLDSGIRSLVPSPSVSHDHTLYASTAKGIVVSADGGVHWKRTGPPGIAILSISPAYASDRTLFAGTEHGLFVTRDAGLTWAPVGGAAGSVSAKLAAVGVSPAFASDGTVLASLAGVGLVRSLDRGRSFSPTGSSLLRDGLVIGDFENPTSEPIQYSPGYARDRTVFAYAAQSVVRSTDGGVTWTVLRIPPASAFLATKTGGGSPSVTKSGSGSGGGSGPVAVGVAVALLFALGVGVTVDRHKKRPKPA